MSAYKTISGLASCAFGLVLAGFSTLRADVTTFVTTNLTTFNVGTLSGQNGQLLHATNAVNYTQQTNGVFLVGAGTSGTAGGNGNTVIISNAVLTTKGASENNANYNWIAVGSFSNSVTFLAGSSWNLKNEGLTFGSGAASVGNSLILNGGSINNFGDAGRLTSSMFSMGGVSNQIVVQNGGQLDSFLQGGGFAQANTIGGFGNNVLVSDPTSLWSLDELIVSGNNAMLVVSNGARTTLDSGMRMTGVGNTLLVAGAGSVLSNAASNALGLNIGGVGGSNTLIIANGGAVIDRVTGAAIGGGDGSNGSFNAVLVTGSGSVWTNTGFNLGASSGSGLNSLVISNGGAVVGGGATLGAASGSTSNWILVTGNGSSWTNSGILTVGAAGSSSNSLTVVGGGKVIAAGLTVGDGSGANANSVIVTNGGNFLMNTGTLLVGSAAAGAAGGNGNVVILSNALLTASSASYIGSGSSSNSVTLLANATLNMGTAVLTLGTGTSQGNLLAVNGGVATNIGVVFGSGFTMGGTTNELLIQNGGKFFNYVQGGGFAVAANLNGGGNQVVATDPGSLLSLDELVVGGSNMTMLVSNGAVATLDSGVKLTGANNTIAVTGAGSILSNAASNTLGIDIGSAGGSNSLIIANGGAVIDRVAGAIIGGAGGSNGSANAVLVAGAGSVWTNTGFSLGASSGSGLNSLVISNGGAVAGGGATIGAASGSTSNWILVTGIGSSWTNSGILTVGAAGSSSNSLTVVGGGKVIAAGLTVGGGSGANANSVIVTNGGNFLMNTGTLLVGSAAAGAAGGNGNVVILSNALLTASSASYIGSGSSSNSVTLLANATLNMGTAVLTLGTGTSQGNLLAVNGGVATNIGVVFGSGFTMGGTTNELLIQNGGKFFNYIQGGGFAVAANLNGGGNQVVATDPSSLLSLDELVVGGSNMTMLVSNGAVATLDSGVKLTGANNTIAVTGAGSILSNAASNTLGIDIGSAGGSNSLIIANGGAVIDRAASAIIGGAGGSNGSANAVLVTGAGSVWTNTGFSLGASSGSGLNSLVISNGGAVAGGGATIGAASGSTSNWMLVTGIGSSWTNSGVLTVGAAGSSSNSLTVVGGGKVSASSLLLGNAAGANANSVIVTNGGQLSLGGTVTVGGGNNNALLINSGGLLQSTGLSIATGTGNTISNTGGIYQFTTATPTITDNGFGNITINNGTISFLGINNANISNSFGGSISYSGANTFMLNSASNTASGVGQNYTFNAVAGNPSNFAGLAMVNGQTAYGNGNITVGSAGSMLLSNTLATISGLVTNQGSLSVVGASAIFQGTVVNSGSAGMLNSIGTFSSGLINSGAWATDPSTNVFLGFGLTNAASGVISMSAGDVYIFTNAHAGQASSFVNVSTNNTANNLLPGKMLFSGGQGLTQAFTVAGHDLGPAPSTSTLTATNLMLIEPGPVFGFTNNFALGTLQIANATTVEVSDAFLGVPGLGSNDNLIAALYLQNLDLGANSLLIIDTNVQVYFVNSNNWNLANIRLENNQSSVYGADAFNYDNSINGLHQIAVVPEPSVLLMVMCGAFVVWISIRRQRRRNVLK